MSTDLEKISISDEENGSSESYHIEKGTETVMMKEDVIPVYDPKEDPKNPLNWPRGKKNMNIAIMLSISFMSYFSSTIYVPASHDIMLYFNTDLTPLFWAPLSERVGRNLILGPPVAAIVGGYIDQYLGWQWIFYIMAIMGSILTIVSILFLSESLYRPERDNLPKPSTLGDRLRRMKFNPFSSLILLKEPDVFLVCLSIGVSFGCFYFFVAILPSTFSPIYGFSPSQVGLCFIAGGLGNALGSIVVGHIDYRYCTYQKKKNGGVDCKEFKLKLMYAVIPFIFLGTLLYGWFLHFKLHWMGALAVFSCTVAASNFSRSLFAMIFSISAVKIREAMGDAWT
ncbi:hypothetical protein HPULCUR_009804 [Helicostylum pulchrum]|uniref:MFS general substrate transporter n=1 Tax=Helicostylum pulchrum TaxID=562976 RepID=A0ABP9YBH4_9FUNG